MVAPGHEASSNCRCLGRRERLEAHDGLNWDSTVVALTGGYDMNGNLTFAGTRTFTYDVENRLQSDSVASSSVLALAHDPLRRINQTTDTTGST